MVGAFGILVAAIVAALGWRRTARLAFENQRQILRLQVLNEARKSITEGIRTHLGHLQKIGTSLSLLPTYIKAFDERDWQRYVPEFNKQISKTRKTGNDYERRLAEYRVLLPETIEPGNWIATLSRFAYLPLVELSLALEEADKGTKAEAMGREAAALNEGLIRLLGDLLIYVQDHALHRISGQAVPATEQRTSETIRLKVDVNGRLVVEPGIHEWMKRVKQAATTPENSESV